MILNTQRNPSQTKYNKSIYYTYNLPKLQVPTKDFPTENKLFRIDTDMPAPYNENIRS